MIVEKLGFSARFATLTRQRILRRANWVKAQSSRHEVPNDPEDNNILQAALASGADYLVTNDAQLLTLDPYLGLRIISMTDYYTFLENQGLIA